MNIRKMLFVVSAYPKGVDSNWAFIQPVVHEIAKLGIECYVFAPQSLTRIVAKKAKKRPDYWEDTNENGNVIHIYQPKIITFSNLFPKLNTFIAYKAIKRIIKRKKLTADVVYSHFWENAVIASKILVEKPHFVATGEDKIWVYNTCSRKKIEYTVNNIKGIISVSSKNLKESNDLRLINKNVRTIVLPNGVNSNIFYHIPKNIARKELGYEQDYKIGIFVGQFNERKGINRVVEAAKKIPTLKLIFIGKGPIQINKNAQILYIGQVKHEDVVKYLCASDFFILPTLAEGCCNAIVEALACGLPVISSDMDFNDDILSNEYSIKIDPLNINQIYEAMLKLLDDNKLYEMSNNAYNYGKQLSIEKRVYSIMKFIKETGEHNDL